MDQRDPYLDALRAALAVTDEGRFRQEQAAMLPPGVSPTAIPSLTPAVGQVQAAQALVQPQNPGLFLDQYLADYLFQTPIRDSAAAGYQAAVEAPGTLPQAIGAGFQEAWNYLRENFPEYMRLVDEEGRRIDPADRPTQPGFGELFAQDNPPLPPGVTPEQLRADVADLVTQARTGGFDGGSGGRRGISPQGFAARYGLDPEMNPLQMAAEAGMMYGLGDEAMGAVADVGFQALDVTDAALRGASFVGDVATAIGRLRALPEDQVLGLTRELRRLAADAWVSPDPLRVRVAGDEYPANIPAPRPGIDAFGPSNAADLADVLSLQARTTGEFRGLSAQELDALGRSLEGLTYREAVDSLVGQLDIDPAYARSFIESAGVGAPEPPIAIAGAGVYTPMPAAVADEVPLPDGGVARELRPIYHFTSPGAPGFDRFDLSHANSGAGGAHHHGAGTIWFAEDPLVAAAASVNLGGRANLPEAIAVGRVASSGSMSEDALRSGVRAFDVGGFTIGGKPFAPGEGPTLRPSYTTAQKLYDMEQPVPDDLSLALGRAVYYGSGSLDNSAGGVVIGFRDLETAYLDAGADQHMIDALRHGDPDAIAEAFRSLVEQVGFNYPGRTKFHANDSRYAWIRDFIFGGNADDFNEFLAAHGYEGLTAMSTELTYQTGGEMQPEFGHRIYALFRPETVLNYDDIEPAVNAAIDAGRVDPSNPEVARWLDIMDDRARSGVSAPGSQTTVVDPPSPVGVFARAPEERELSALYALDRGTRADIAAYRDLVDDRFEDTMFTLSGQKNFVGTPAEELIQEALYRVDREYIPQQSWSSIFGGKAPWELQRLISSDYRAVGPAAPTTGNWNHDYQHATPIRAILARAILDLRPSASEMATALTAESARSGPLGDAVAEAYRRMALPDATTLRVTEDEMREMVAGYLEQLGSSAAGASLSGASDLLVGALNYGGHYAALPQLAAYPNPVVDAPLSALFGGTPDPDDVDAARYAIGAGVESIFTDIGDRPYAFGGSGGSSVKDELASDFRAYMGVQSAQNRVSEGWPEARASLRAAQEIEDWLGQQSDDEIYETIATIASDAFANSLQRLGRAGDEVFEVFGNRPQEIEGLLNSAEWRESVRIAAREYLEIAAGLDMGNITDRMLNDLVYDINRVLSGEMNVRLDEGYNPSEYILNAINDAVSSVSPSQSVPGGAP